MLLATTNVCSSPALVTLPFSRTSSLYTLIGSWSSLQSQVVHWAYNEIRAARTWPPTSCCVRGWTINFISIFGLLPPSTGEGDEVDCSPPSGNVGFVTFRRGDSWAYSPLWCPSNFTPSNFNAPTLSPTSLRRLKHPHTSTLFLSLSHSQTYIGILFLRFTHKLVFFLLFSPFFFLIIEEGLGFLGTMVFASSPILGTPGSSTKRHVVDLGSPPLLTREWTYEATKYLIKLVKKKIKSYVTNVFNQQHSERITKQVMRDHPSEARQT